MRELRVIGPATILGLNPIDEEAFYEGLKKKPDYIAIQGGGTDAGPKDLALDLVRYRKDWMKQNLKLILRAARELDVPFLSASVGNQGTDFQVAFVTSLVKEVAKEEGLHFRLAVLLQTADKEFIKKKIAQNKVKIAGNLKPLTPEDVDACTRINVMMGVEPFIKALNDRADIIIGGRTTDPAVFAALPIKEGFDPGLAWHMGKIMECGCLAATPPDDRTAVMGYIRDDHFLVEPASSKMICTVESVAGHTLYERENPYKHLEPGGTLDITNSKIEMYDTRTVKVSGSKFIPRPFSAKLEGAGKVGYQASTIMGIRDPFLLAQIDNVIGEVRAKLAKQHSRDKFELFFRQYGKNAVLGDIDPQKNDPIHEIALMVDVIADSQETANKIALAVFTAIFFMSYPGMKQTAGNVAVPGDPGVFIPISNEVCRWIVDHEMMLDNPMECFGEQLVEV